MNLDTIPVANAQKMIIAKNIRDDNFRIYLLCSDGIKEVEYGRVAYGAKILSYDGIQPIRDVKLELINSLTDRYYYGFADMNGNIKIFVEPGIYNIKSVKSELLYTTKRKH